MTFNDALTVAVGVLTASLITVIALDIWRSRRK